MKPSTAASRPYPTITKPVPAPAYRYYPNFTPPTLAEGKVTDAPRIRDTRPLYPEIEDDTTGQLWMSEEPTHHDDIRMVEWSEARSRRERWVGPMMYVSFFSFPSSSPWDTGLTGRLVAQLHPATRSEPFPQSANHGPAEGPTPDLGPKGMYASLAFEDVAALLPWIEFKGGGAYHTEAMRSGLGYE